MSKDNPLMIRNGLHRMVKTHKHTSAEPTALPGNMIISLENGADRLDTSRALSSMMRCFKMHSFPGIKPQSSSEGSFRRGVQET